MTAQLPLVPARTTGGRYRYTLTREPGLGIRGELLGDDR